MNNTSVAGRAIPDILQPFPLSKRVDGRTPHRCDERVDSKGPGRLSGRATRITIAGNQAASVQVSVGTAIQSLTGTIWLTQENDTRDYCVPPGTTFCADRAGRAVLTSLEDRAVVVVHDEDAFAIARTPGTLTVDSFERLTRAARKAQQDALVDIAKRLMGWLTSAMRRLR